MQERGREMLLRFKNDLKQDVGIDKFGIIEVGYFSYQSTVMGDPLGEFLITHWHSHENIRW